MSFAIVGGGPTGVELAGALSELKRKILPKDYPDLDLRDMQIHLIEAGPRILAGMSKESSQKSTDFLRQLGVNVWLDTGVKTYNGETVETNTDLTIISKNLIWSAGVKGDLPKTSNELKIGRGNRIVVNEFCEILGLNNAYSLGDMAQIESEDNPIGHPMMASVAMQQGTYLGKSFNKKIKKKPVKPFVYKDKGVMATIGRNKAVAEIAKFKFKGVFAWLVWMFVHLMLLVGFRNRVVVFINWVWNYVKFNNGHRLIIRKSQKTALTKETKEDTLVS
jgi:NADH dehydrogenase